LTQEKPLAIIARRIMAKPLDRLEETIERVMKDAITQRLGGRLHPIEIARKLSQAMDANQTITAQRVLVPNLYAVHLNPGDVQALEPFRATLEREMASYLAQAMEEEGFSTVAYPRVILMEDPAIPRRKVVVDARIAEGDHAPSPEEQHGNTVRLQILTAETLAGEAWLVSSGPAGKELAHPIAHLPFSLGRALDNDVVLEGRGMSRHHAQIRAVHGHFYLMDLSSTNGTYLNGRRVAESILKHGDIITLGPVQFVFRRQPG